VVAALGHCGCSEQMGNKAFLMEDLKEKVVVE